MIWNDEPEITVREITESYDYGIEQLYKNKHIALVGIPSRFGTYTTVRHTDNNDAVVVLLFSRGKVLLVQQVRYAVGQEIWELPRGLVEEKEASENAAHREIMEETNLSIYNKTKLKSLGQMLTDSGLIATNVELFYGEINENDFTEGDLIETENASWFSLSAIEDAIKNGLIQDNFTIAALYRAKLAGLLIATKR